MSSAPVVFRPLSLADGPALIDLAAAYRAELDIEMPPDDEVREAAAGSIDLAANTMGAEVDGELVGFNIFTTPGAARLRGLVARQHRRRGIGTGLLVWGVGRARMEPGVDQLMIGADSRRQDAVDLYRAQGFGYTRTFLRMTLETPRAAAPPTWPAGLVCRNDLTGERLLDALVEAHDEGFEGHWDHHRLPRAAHEGALRRTGAAPDLCFFAFDDEAIAGFSVCEMNGPRGFIDMLAVKPRFRGRGIAAALLGQSIAELSGRGATLVELSVDSENPTGALGLYARAGMAPGREFVIYRLAL